MDDADRDRIITSHDAWRNAVKALNDELDRYVAAGWTESPDPRRRPEPLDRPAWERIERLRESERAARADFDRVLDEARGRQS